MGGSKRSQEEKEQKLEVATEIALRAKVLIKCEFHETVMNNQSDIKDAYRLGNVLIKNELMNIFDSPVDMTNHVKEAVEVSALDCYQCEKWENE